MKITPLDIRQKSFANKAFGGFDKDEVNAFLETLSRVWEKVLEENRELRIRLEGAENELKELREVERALHRTLKTAEETTQKMVEQAENEAQLTIKNAQLKAETIEKEAKWRAKAILEEAESDAKNTYKNLHNEVRSLEDEYKRVENMRDNLMGELKNLSSDILEKIDKISTRNKVLFIAPQQKPVGNYPNYLTPGPADSELKPNKPQAEGNPSLFEQAVQRPETNNQGGNSGSFFDELD